MKEKQYEMKRIQSNIPESIFKFLCILCDSRKQSMNRLVRSILIEYVEEKFDLLKNLKEDE